MMDERPIREIEAGSSLEEIFSNATDDSDGWFDKPLIPWVIRINAMGVETLQSCSGHPKEENRGYACDGHLSFSLPEYFDIERFVYNLVEQPGIYVVRRNYHPWDGMMVIFEGKNRSIEKMAESMDLIEYAITIGLVGAEERPCGYCWGHQPGENDCPAQHPMECVCEPEGGLAEPHPECLKSASRYVTEAKE